MIRLSPRLAAVAALAGTGESVIDVGTDHGYLPVYLVQSGAFARVAASDINAGPLWTARCSARERGLEERIEFYLSDGLKSVPGEFDTVVMAGMGGETVRDILRDLRWSREPRLILQPQSKVGELTAFLRSGGYGCGRAVLCRDAGRMYAAFEALPGVYGEEFGLKKALFDARDPLLRPCLEQEIGRVEKVLEGLERAKDSGGTEALALKTRRSLLERDLREVEKWQE